MRHTLTTELGGKRLELLQEAVPKLGRVAVLYDPILPASVRDVKDILPVAARGLGMTVQLEGYEARTVLRRYSLR
jgi:hypothetical protein